MATRAMIETLKQAVEHADAGRLGVQQYWPRYEKEKGTRQLIDRLVRQGFITIEPDNRGWEDYRKLAPTQAGRELVSTSLRS